MKRLGEILAAIGLGLFLFTVFCALPLTICWAIIKFVIHFTS